MIQRQRFRYSCVWLPVLLIRSGNYITSCGWKWKEPTAAYCKETHRQPTAHQLFSSATKHDTVLTSTPDRLTFSRRDINQPRVLEHTHFHTYASLLTFRFHVFRYPNYFATLCWAILSTCPTITSSHCHISFIALFLVLVYLYSILKVLSSHKPLRLIFHHHSHFLGSQVAYAIYR